MCHVAGLKRHCLGDIIVCLLSWTSFPKTLAANLLRKWNISTSNFIYSMTRSKRTVYSASMCRVSLIIISTQKALHALQSKCHPVYIALSSCEWSLLSKAFRKSCHVWDEEIRRAGRKTLLSSSEQCCPSLLPDKAKCLLICLWSLC